MLQNGGAGIPACPAAQPQKFGPAARGRQECLPHPIGPRQTGKSAPPNQPEASRKGCPPKNCTWTDDWRVRMGSWLGGSVVIIGIGWPLVLMVLIRAGLAPPRPVREPAYDLDRFKSENAPTMPAGREIDPKEIEKLHVLEAELER